MNFFKKQNLKLVLEKELKVLFKNEFGRNFLTTFSGIGLSQLIPILISPILTRLFSPEDFGLLALYISTTLLMGNISTMQFDAAIMLPKEDEDSINLMALAFVNVIGVTIVTFFIVLFFKEELYKIMGNSAIGYWLYILPFSVLLTGIFKILNIWSSRKKKFKRLALRNIMQSSTTGGFKICIGIFSNYNYGLILGTIIGQIAATSVLLLQTIILDKINCKKISKSKMKTLAKRYKEFPIYLNLQTFLNTFNDTGIKYLISNFYGVAVLGFYTFSNGLLQRPIQLIGNSISQVYYQKAVEIYNSNRDLWTPTRKIMFRLLLIGLIIYSPILIFGRVIFSFVFGESWEIAGLYAQIMVPWFISNFIFQFSTIIPQIVNKQKAFFKIGALFNIMFFLFVYVLSLLKTDFIIMLSIMSTFMLLFITMLYFWFKKITNKTPTVQ